MDEQNRRTNGDPCEFGRTRSEVNRELHRSAAEKRKAIERGVAGASARGIADRAAKRNRATPNSSVERVVSNYTKGAEGEAAVAAQLAWLDGKKYWILHDQPWPGRPYANIDHIVVGVSGIYVIDAKNWSGKVTVGNTGLFRDGRKVSSVVKHAKEQADALNRIVANLTNPLDLPIAARAILAFRKVRSSPATINSVHVMDWTQLAPFIDAQQEFIPEAEVGRIAFDLEQALETDNELAKLIAAERRKRGAKLARAKKSNVCAPAPQEPQGKSASSHSARVRRAGKTDVARELVRLLALAVTLGAMYWLITHLEVLIQSINWLLLRVFEP